MHRPSHQSICLYVCMTNVRILQVRSYWLRISNNQTRRHLATAWHWSCWWCTQSDYCIWATAVSQRYAHQHQRCRQPVRNKDRLIPNWQHACSPDSSRKAAETFCCCVWLHDNNWANATVCNTRKSDSRRPYDGRAQFFSRLDFVRQPFDLSWVPDDYLMDIQGLWTFSDAERERENKLLAQHSVLVLRGPMAQVLSCFCIGFVWSFRAKQSTSLSYARETSKQQSLRLPFRAWDGLCT